MAFEICSVPGMIGYCYVLEHLILEPIFYEMVFINLLYLS